MWAPRSPPPQLPGPCGGHARAAPVLAALPTLVGPLTRRLFVGLMRSQDLRAVPELIALLVNVSCDAGVAEVRAAAGLLRCRAHG